MEKFQEQNQKMVKTNQNTGILIAFLLTLAAGIYLFIENNKLKERIERFIPAAIEIENDNKMLKATKLKLEGELSLLMLFKDSIDHKIIKASVERGFSTMDSITPANANPGSQNGIFSDLNKNVH